MNWARCYGWEVWDYQYDLLNRLVAVKKNGTLISEYGYDPEGLRVVKRAHGETIHYVFEGTEPVYEKNVTTGKAKSYVFALGKHLARVDGLIGDPVAKKYWYTTDHLGSVKAATDETGKVVFQADHLAFGQRYGETGDFEEWHSFTGKEFDPDTGLYYYNARWYDADTGRFISEDPAADPNNPNLYTYCANNPLSFIDPTGKDYLPGCYTEDGQPRYDWEPNLDQTYNDLPTPSERTTITYYDQGGYAITTQYTNGTISTNYYNSKGVFLYNSVDYQMVMNLVSLYEKRDLLYQNLQNYSSQHEVVMITEQIELCNSEIRDEIREGNKIKHSKLSLDYKMADPSKYLVFGNKDQSGIDLIFAARLAAFAKDRGTKIYIDPNGGYRDYEDQAQAYENKGGIQNEKGEWVPGPNWKGGAARPGISWHEYGEAIDIWWKGPTSGPLKKLYKDAKTSAQTELLKYGLFKPMTKGNGYGVGTKIEYFVPISQSSR